MHEVRRSFRVRCDLRLACLMMALLIPMAQHSQAQQQTVLPAALRRHYELHLENASLETITETLMKMGHISILVDGEPLRTEDSLKLEGTLAETLDRVAGDFDYSWRVTKSGVVLMTKRFTNLQERPQLNLPEMRQMAREMDQVLSNLPGDVPASTANEDIASLLKALMGSLTAAQNQTLHTGVKLRSADLAPAQAQLLGQALLVGAFGYDRILVRKLTEWLDALPDSSISAKRVSNLPEEEEARYDNFLTALDRHGKTLLQSFARPLKPSSTKKFELKGNRLVPKQ